MFGQYCVPVGATNMTKTRAHHKIGAAMLTYVVSRFGRDRFLPLGYSRLPELLPLFVIFRGACHRTILFFTVLDSHPSCQTTKQVNLLQLEIVACIGPGQAKAEVEIITL
jgi:hypothetical protein